MVGRLEFKMAEEGDYRERVKGEGSGELDVIGRTFRSWNLSLRGIWVDFVCKAIAGITPESTVVG